MRGVRHASMADGSTFSVSGRMSAATSMSIGCFRAAKAELKTGLSAGRASATVATVFRVATSYRAEPTARRPMARRAHSRISLA